MQVLIRVTFYDEDGTQVDKTMRTEVSGPDVLYVTSSGIKANFEKMYNLGMLDFLGEEWIADFEQRLSGDDPEPVEAIKAVGTQLGPSAYLYKGGG